MSLHKKSKNISTIFRPLGLIAMLCVAVVFTVITMLGNQDVRQYAQLATTTQVKIDLKLHGLGRGGDNANPASLGNMSPRRTQRIVTIDVLNNQNRVVATKQGLATYNAASGTFMGTIDLGSTIANGSYTLKVKTDQFLKTTVPGTQQLRAGQTNQLPTVTLVSGDVDNNNMINILDYNLVMGCFSDLTPAILCAAANKLKTDMTDDGNVNHFDYNLFIREVSNKSGEPGHTPAPTIRVTLTPIIRPTIVPTIVPTVSPSGAYRAFSNVSYWNTPMPANAPIDVSSATYIADALRFSGNHLQFTGAPGTGQNFAQPIYWGKVTDKLYTITASGITVSVHIPKGATAATGSDGQMVIFDLSSNQVVGIHQAVYNAATDTWSTASGIDRYYLNSNGLDRRVVGSDNNNNFGHRGIPASVRAVRVDEVKAGAINHQLECFWHATAEKHYWPMAGHESGKGGVVPEGIVARIKPSVNIDAKPMNQSAKIIAKALQKYGCMVGDNSGSSTRLKLERNESEWTTLGITKDSLSPITWSEWEFIKGGYDPVTQTIR